MPNIKKFNRWSPNERPCKSIWRQYATSNIYLPNIAGKNVGNTAIFMPGESCLDIKLALKNGIISNRDKIIIVEEDKNLFDPIKKEVKKIGIKKPIYHFAPLSELDLNQLSNIKIKYAFLDFCGEIKSDICSWLNNIDPSLVVPTARFLFTFSFFRSKGYQSLWHDILKYKLKEKTKDNSSQATWTTRIKVDNCFYSTRLASSSIKSSVKDDFNLVNATIINLGLWNFRAFPNELHCYLDRCGFWMFLFDMALLCESKRGDNWLLKECCDLQKFGYKKIVDIHPQKGGEKYER
jgi:hypothetical protein